MNAALIYTFALTAQEICVVFTVNMDPAAVAYPRQSGNSEHVDLHNVIAQRPSYTLSLLMQSEFSQSQQSGLPQS